MAARTTLDPDTGLALALAVVGSSTAPLILLDGDFRIVAASASFFDAFQTDRAGAAGRSLFDLRSGEWNVPQLRALLKATAAGSAQVDAYEMDLKGDRSAPWRLIVNAQKLDYGDPEHIRLLLSVADVTDARLADKLKDDLLREKVILLQEIQHRVANSLQIIASVILQSARRVQSEEARSYLTDAHSRVMSVATLQQQLAASRLGQVELRDYFVQLCDSIAASMIRDPRQLALEVHGDASVRKPWTGCHRTRDQLAEARLSRRPARPDRGGLPCTRPELDIVGHGRRGGDATGCGERRSRSWNKHRGGACKAAARTRSGRRRAPRDNRFLGSYPAGVSRGRAAIGSGDSAMTNPSGGGGRRHQRLK